MNLARVLDDEFLRVAKAEEITLEELVNDVAAYTGISPRQLYNYRCGKQDIPSKHIPALCRRFNSQALIRALIEDCAEVTIEIPESYELIRMLSQSARQHLQHHEKYMQAFEDGVDPCELSELRKSGERVIQSLREFEAIAAADCERRMARRQKIQATS